VNSYFLWAPLSYLSKCQTIINYNLTGRASILLVQRKAPLACATSASYRSLWLDTSRSL